MKEKLYDIPIDKPLTSARRKALNLHIVQNVSLTNSPISYQWDELDGEVLHLTAETVKFEVRFQTKKVEIYGTAPLWARLLLTAKKKEQLKQEIQSILSVTGFCR